MKKLNINIIKLLLAFGSLVLLSCTEGSIYPFDDGPAPTKTDSIWGDYFPNTENETWVYLEKDYLRGTYDTIIAEVTDRVLLSNGYTAARIEYTRFSDNDKFIEYRSIEDSSVISYGSINIDITDPKNRACLFRLPLKYNKTWEVRDLDQSYGTDYALVQKSVTLDLPYGHFDDLFLVVRSVYTQDQHMEILYCFEPGLGIVYRSVVDKNSESRIAWELMEYKSN